MRENADEVTPNADTLYAVLLNSVNQSQNILWKIADYYDQKIFVASRVTEPLKGLTSWKIKIFQENLYDGCS